MSRNVGVVWDSVFLNHNAGDGHPERTERLIAIREVLQEKGLFTRMKALPVREATREELERNHSPSHVSSVLESSEKEHTIFDGDTIASPWTARAASKAAGGSIELAKAVLSREVDTGISLCRPPGHHAEYHTPMGFCYFNNIAIVARALLEEEGLSRILIVDWDVHHGNGTQHSFEDDPRVLFFSIHQSPFYPGTGRINEIGSGKGEGYTVNVPVPGMLGDNEFLFAFQRILRPIAEQFQPDMILLSAGYDAHRQDLLGSMRVTTPGYASLTQELLQLAEDLCGGRLAAFLEGGYDLDGLSTSVAATITAMFGDEVETSGDAAQADELMKELLADLARRLTGIWTLPS